MAWIKVYQSLPSHKKLKKLKRLLKVKTPAAVGHVVMLWLWAIDNAPDGCLADLDDEDIAEAAEWQGDPEKFVEALVQAGFIDPGLNGDVSKDVSVLHDWCDYTGGLMDAQNEAKKKNRDRQRRYREQKKTCDSNVTDDATVTLHNADVALDSNVTDTLRNAPRIDKNRIDKTTPPYGGVDKGVTRNVTQQPQSRAVCAYLDMISPTPSSSSMRELMEFEKDMGSDVCLRAIDEALDANARSWPYIKSILKSKREQGVKSIQDWDRLNAERMDAKHRTVASKAAEEDPDGFRGPSDLGDNEAIFKEMEGWK